MPLNMAHIGFRGLCLLALSFLAPTVTVGETEGAMESASTLIFLPLLLPITL